MMQHKISICRSRKYVEIGCFDSFDLLREFIEYDIDKEDQGVSDAKDFFTTQGVDNPEIVYPRITSMRMR